MKRSSQVALLVGGLTVAGAGAYAMTPPRRDCVAPTQQPGSAGAVAPSPSGGVTMAPISPGAPGTAVPAVGQQPQNDPCRRSRRWGSWGPSYTSGDSRSSRTFWPGSSRTSTSGPVRTNISPTSRSTSRSTPRSTSSPTTSRGGFGSTGSSAGRSSS